MLIYLSAGEPSGDMHGAALARLLRARRPDLELIGMGGPLMRQAGVEIIHDPTRGSTIGFVEAIKNLNEFRRLLRRIRSVLEERRPDAVVWIDFGGFNLALAKICREIGLPIICVFSPSAWAYGEKRAVLMAQRLTELAAVLPFEADYYRRFGLKTTYVGHPLLDLVKTSETPEAFRAALGIQKGEKVLAILPGSRRLEIERLLPSMLATLGQLRAGDSSIKAILPMAASVSEPLIRAAVERAGQEVILVHGRAYDVLGASDLAIIASGTATLEAAILGVPHISIYRISPLSLAIYRLLQTPRQRRQTASTALPNLIAGREIVPELLQGDLTIPALTASCRGLLQDASRREQIRQELAGVRQMLGPPGAMSRVAELVLHLAAGGGTGDEEGK